MSRTFQRNIEDFVCEQCGCVVKGDGYTNHCPSCLWSKHVDKNPGDRAEECGGMMKPVAVEGTSPEYTLLHRCARCGFERRNKLLKDDNMHAVLRIAKQRQ